MDGVHYRNGNPLQKTENASYATGPKLWSPRLWVWGRFDNWETQGSDPWGVRLVLC